MALATTMLESRLTLKRFTVGRDDHEGVTQDPVTVYNNVPCCVSNTGANEKDQFEQRQTSTGYTIYTIQRLAVEINDQVTVVDKEGVTHKFNVIAGEARGGTFRRIQGCVLHSFRVEEII